MLWSPKRTMRETLYFVDQYIRSRFIYSNEQIETLQMPEYMLRGYEINGHLVGDCDDISILHATLLSCLDYKVRFVVIKSTPSNPNFDHVFIEALDGGEWLPFDVTVPANLKHQYFGKLTIAV